MIQEPIDITNDFFVGVSREELVVPLSVMGRVPREKALRLAAWIVAMLDRNGDFDRILAAVVNT